MKQIQYILNYIFQFLTIVYRKLFYEITQYKNDLPLKFLLHKELLANSTKKYLYTISLVIPIALYVNYISTDNHSVYIAYSSILLLSIYVFSYSFYVAMIEKRIKQQYGIEEFFIIKKISDKKKTQLILILAIPTVILIKLIISFKGISAIFLSFFITLILLLPIIIVFYLNDIINQKINRNDLEEI